MERYAIVLNRSCCGGHQSGTIVRVTEEKLMDQGVPISRCIPIRNQKHNIDMWHCDSCLMFISKEEAYGTIKSN